MYFKIFKVFYFHVGREWLIVIGFMIHAFFLIGLLEESFQQISVFTDLFAIKIQVWKDQF